MPARHRQTDIGDAPVVVGRAPESDLPIPHRSVSREHCRIWRDGNAYRIRDLGATNATRVNDRRIEHEAVLADGTPDTAAMTDGGWALLPDGTGNDAVDDVELGADGLAITVSADSPVIVELGAGDPPAALPVVAGETARTTNSSAAYGGGTALDFDVDPVLTAHSVPLLGPRGVLIDYDTFSTGREVYDQNTEVYVLARDDTPDDVVAAMRDAVGM